jgi:uncharacterized membrane protein
MKKTFEKQNDRFMHDNPDNWKGMFYFNKNDFRVIVPKKDPNLGWTLNFGNPYTYIGLTLIIAIIVVFSLIF